MLESLFNKVAGLQACNYFKKRLEHRCFPLNIAKFLRTALFIEHLQWLILYNRKPFSFIKDRGAKKVEKLNRFTETALHRCSRKKFIWKCFEQLNNFAKKFTVHCECFLWISLKFFTTAFSQRRIIV